MSSVRSLVFPATYRDSVFLMQLSNQARDKSGARQVSAIMASARNKELLARSELLTPELEEAGPDDLVVAIEAPPELLDETEALIRSMLAEPVPRPEGVSEAASLPLTLSAALLQRPESRLAIVSVAGDYARYEAAQALALGLDVFLYSGDISLRDERALKDLARTRGCLLMGPDCGSAIVDGVPLGFTNALRKGFIGLVSSSGTGLQEVCCLLDRCGLGISHAYGTGGRDAADEIGGITTLAALQRLADDPDTEVIALIASNPGPETRKRLAQSFGWLKKPVVLYYPGVVDYGPEKRAGAAPAGNLAELARLSALTLAPLLDLGAIEEEEPSFASFRDHKPGVVRGVFDGGALCQEALEIVAAKLGCSPSSNLRSRAGSSPGDSSGHYFMDIGAPAFTVGRPHPLIAPENKMEQVYLQLMDPAVAVVMTDLVLGYGVSIRQATLLVRTMDRAAAESDGASRKKALVVSVCGTELDKPSRSSQVLLLRQAGVLVAGNNAQAARWAAHLAKGGPARRGNHRRLDDRA